MKKKPTKEEKKVWKKIVPERNAKKPSEITNEEFPQVHIITDKAEHLGISAPESKREDNQSETIARKADVRLQIDELIWNEAEKKAARSSIKMPEYVEKALVQYNNPEARTTEG